MCYHPLCFVCEARVQQGLTACAFKGISFAGTKTQPLHHEESDNLINVTIYSTHPSALPTAPRCSPTGLSIELNTTTFWVLVICSDRALEAREVAIYCTCKNICLDSFTQLFSKQSIPCQHCTHWTIGGPYLALFFFFFLLLWRLLCCSFISRP